MINFQRDKLAGQVFGAPFIGSFQQHNGPNVRFPMDFLGTTTGIYFWSKENSGEEDLKLLAAAWNEVRANAAGRYRFVSVNMDNLPDFGESILRKHQLDWPALQLPEGQDSPIYRAYVRRDTPTILTVSPTGYAAMYLSGSRSDRTYERRLQSMLARTWANAVYSSQLQSVCVGEFLVMSADEEFDPTAPPEWKASGSPDSAVRNRLPNHATSVPADKLRAIQACFLDPPLRYRTPRDQIVASYEQADALCRASIAAHPQAPNLWIVRNRRIIALMGLWKTLGDQEHFAAAVAEARTVLEEGCPPGTDVVPRLCLAREAIRAGETDTKTIIHNFPQVTSGQASSPALAATALLALDAGDRKLHEQYRREFLDNYADTSAMWAATAFLLDRYQRYWMYHPPFVAGWTYGRRQGHFLAIGRPDDAVRSIEFELKTLEDETLRFPADASGKWTIIEFRLDAEASPHLQRYGTFVNDRPFDDVRQITAILDEDVTVVRAAYAKRLEEQAKRKQVFDHFEIAVVPDGIKNPLTKKLGILSEDTRPNILILRPDGTIATFLSGLSMSAQSGNVLQNVIQWHDEQVVDDALAKGDLDKAKRLAFALAPVEKPAAEGGKKQSPQKISVPHRRSRAKVYLALGDLQAAYADAEQAYLEVNSKAGYISMRTAELDETEKLKATILSALEQSQSNK